MIVEEMTAILNPCAPTRRRLKHRTSAVSEFARHIDSAPPRDTAISTPDRCNTKETPRDMMNFSPVEIPRRPSLADGVVQQLQKMIVDGTLTPGMRLPPERQLATQLEVSRVSLREALHKLEAKGMLSPRNKGGYLVANVTAPLVTKPIVELMALFPEALRDVLELRRGIEGTAAFLAAQRAKPTDIERIKRACDALEACDGRPAGRQAVDHDVGFHLAIATAAHNVAISQVTQGLLELLDDTIRRTRTQLSENNEWLVQINKQHRRIFNAVADGDPPAARSCAEDHINFLLERLCPPTGQM